MTHTPHRLDGWKAIAGHFRRNRSTVIRWAEAGDFPVHRVGGQAGASVWAYAHELDAWLIKGGDAHTEEKVETVPVPPESSASEPIPPAYRTGQRLWRTATLAGLLILSGMSAAVLFTPKHVPSRRSAALPTDPEVAQIYIEARNDWASRNPDGLRKAVAELGVVTSREPDFAPAYAALADAYVSSSEFGMMSDSVLAPKAWAAVKAALAIDPDSPEANRTLGLLDYYTHHDLAAARKHLGESLRLAPNVAQTHFDLGGILRDAGDYEAGLRELDLARQENPNSEAMEAEYGLGLWWAGFEEAGVDRLRRISEQSPTLISAHIYLTWAYLVRGDMAAFLHQREALAGLYKNAAFTARVAQERLVFERGGTAALLNLISKAPPVVGDLVSEQTEWPATAAAMTGNRTRLLGLLDRGRAGGEVYSVWRPTDTRLARWRGHREVIDRLKVLRAIAPGA